MTNMRKWRKQAGFTQEKLAELCNTDPCYIRQIENGRRFPSIAYIERIACALNIAPYRLFYNEAGDSATNTQELKTQLSDTISRAVCTVIDERFK